MIKQPISVYINWSAYDELSDNVELTEELAMRQLGEMLRLRESGVRLDYYLMDAFWYAPDGAYRTWRKPHWPNGPDRWLAACLENGVKPGLWVASNFVSKMEPIPEWEDSYVRGKWCMCCFTGGFLAHFMETLHMWYERGVRMFKFDFSSFQAATPALAETLLPSEIRAANVSAFQGALKVFKKQHPEVVFLAYNGYEEIGLQDGTSSPLMKVVDHRWLDVFDSLYCGDPRLADVPAMSFWRSKDIYSDHMVRAYEFNGVPLNRIDSSSFMIGTTGTCYYRGAAAWKGMLLLSLARGGWVNTYYGNLELLDPEKAAWFKSAQSLFFPLQAGAVFTTFGAIPGHGQPYGYTAHYDSGDGLVTIVNPSQQIAAVPLPASGAMRLLFRDEGFQPSLTDGVITLGPEQMALVGVGSYADAQFDLGVQEDVVIPTAIRPLDVRFEPDGAQALTATVEAPGDGVLRVIMRQIGDHGVAKRTTGGSPPDGITLGKILRIEADQNGREVPVTINYDKAIWSGTSWAAGEIDCSVLSGNCPVSIRCSTTEAAKLTLTGEVYHVEYDIS